MNRPHWLHVALPLLLFVPVIYTIEHSGLDLAIQSWLYNFETHQWLWPRDEALGHYILYVGIKVIEGVAAIAIVISLVAFRKSAWIQTHKRGLWIVLLSLLLVPFSVASLKSVTNVACPRDLSLFDGGVPYVDVFSSYPEGERPLKAQKCFPAAHASAGFSLISLSVLTRTSHMRIAAIGFGVLMGWLMGSYKMMIGDHFFSHTLATMLIAWSLIHGIAFALLRRPRHKEFSHTRYKPHCIPEI